MLCLGTRCSRFAVESSVARRDRESEHATKPGGRGRWHCRSEVLPRYLPKSPPAPDSRGPQVEIFLARFNSGHLSTFKFSGWAVPSRLLLRSLWVLLDELLCPLCVPDSGVAGGTRLWNTTPRRGRDPAKVPIPCLHIPLKLGKTPS